MSFLLTYSDEFLKYSLGPNHPMRPDRIVAAMSLMDYHLRDNDDFKIIGPNPVDPSTLTLAHTEEYITLMKKLSVPDSNSYEDIEKGLFFYGLGTSDCPVFDHMAEVSDLIVGSTLTAAQSILNNEFSNAFVLLAGLHHASRERASGFCYYNDINVTIRKLQQENPKIKILYLDTDLHAGDGVNYEFYNDPNVLTISFHESGKYLYPGTCFSDEIGSGDGEGYAINLPLYPNTYDSIYQKSIERYLPSFVESFKPDIILWQAGVDGHAMDPLGHLQLTTNTYDKLGTLVRKLSQHMEQPRVLAM
ncbi:MAG: acetoin utilization protein AcuC, partial [Candidatus Heimdallarchaeota archaeon]|nr:acetoin utilization protein AcuC [Candidatus Heimdallarchaeota archaeon]